MEAFRNAYRILVGKHEGKIVLGLYGRIILKRVVRKYDRKM